MEKSYLYIEPYTLLFVRGNSCLLYNTLDKKVTKLAVDESLLPVMAQLVDKKCIELSLQQLRDDSVVGFIDLLRSTFNGDVLDGDVESVPPAVFSPIVNNQRDFVRLKKYDWVEMGSQVMDYLEEVYIYLNGINSEKGLGVYNQTPSYFYGDEQINAGLLIDWLETINDHQANQINFLGGDIMKHSDFKRIWDVSKKKAVRLNLYYRYDLFVEESISFLKENPCMLFLVVPIPLFDKDVFLRLFLSVQRMEAVHWLFLVTSEADYAAIEDLVKEIPIEFYKVKPIFTGDNLPFFESAVFVDEQDIEANGLTKREVYVSQEINRNDFGRITILPNGKVHANVNKPAIGEIGQGRVSDMLYKEMSEGNSWLCVRNQKPCCDCVYQWLCSSPSNYELVLGKLNLCHVN